MSNSSSAFDTAFDTAFSSLPLVAILRGIEPGDAHAVGQALYDEGFRLIEVPLNSPDPFASIERLARQLPKDAIIGAGTVLEPCAVARVKDSGGALIVMPHADPDVIRVAKAAGLWCVPGFATPTEAFAALAAGADALKLFPAELLTPAVLRALRVVLPRTLRVLPVGGITPDTMLDFLRAGANGFGLGSALYTPGMRPDAVARHARNFVSAWRAQQGG